MSGFKRRRKVVEEEIGFLKKNKIGIILTITNIATVAINVYMMVK